MKRTAATAQRPAANVNYFLYYIQVHLQNINLCYIRCLFFVTVFRISSAEAALRICS